MTTGEHHAAQNHAYDAYRRGRRGGTAATLTARLSAARLARRGERLTATLSGDAYAAAAAATATRGAARRREPTAKDIIADS